MSGCFSGGLAGVDRPINLVAVFFIVFALTCAYVNAGDRAAVARSS